MHSAGYKKPRELLATDISIDTYILPCDVEAGGAVITEDVALIVQHFGQRIVRPHMPHFLHQCKLSGVTLPGPRSKNLFINSHCSCL